MANLKRKKRRATPPPAAQALIAERAAAAAAAAAPAEDAPQAPRRRGQFQDVAAVIKPGMIAYLFWREWWKARNRGDFQFIYDLSAAGSPLREHFGDRDEFSDVCRRKIRPVLGLTEGELRKVRLHSEDECYIVHCIDLNARERRDYDAERWFMLRDELLGWRVHDVARITVSKERDPGTLTLADFPDVTFPEGIKPANG